jgi:hypothetical protein
MARDEAAAPSPSEVLHRPQISLIGDIERFGLG